MLVPDIDPRWKKSGGVAPWSRARVRGEAPVVASNEALEFEKVAAARPDLITAVEYDLKQPDYTKLSELAPTVPPPKGFAPYTVPWDTMARAGRRLARPPRRRRGAREGDARPHRRGRRRRTRSSPASKAVLIDPDDDGGVYIFAENDVRTRFLGDLGCTMPAEIEQLFKGQFYAQISAERLDLLDTADVLVLVASRKPQTRQLDLVAQLPAPARGARGARS